ncbi:hypothetical protein Cni_G05524 [Canna indica]|uniref:Uncharacterized protein n=1 Tax=Canna indica TaxID=4628 RepID=A0AAQ3JVC7_9LILI|nr:hypothetical protein Cni_G05524 [Canna indica]
MASTSIEASKEQQQEHHHIRQHHQLLQGAPSPRKLRRSLSNNSSFGGGKATAAKCVCAPPTHAGSFKCRLHRVNSHGRSAPPPLVSSPHQPAETFASSFDAAAA